MLDQANTPRFRLDVQLHDLLKNPAANSVTYPFARVEEPKSLPQPLFPQRPDLLTDDELEADRHGKPDDPYSRRWTAPLVLHAMRGWLFPYFKSRMLPGQFHPIIAYLFTEWKCNLDCHYCWAFDNNVKGMTEDVARRSIDWLHSTTCRVLALMGGEPLLRPQFAHKVIYYAAKKGFWVYLPTNARLLRPDVIDRIADAGVATINFAVDAIDEKPGLPKALAPIPLWLYRILQHEHLPHQSRRYPPIDRDRSRLRHLDRLSHQRIAHARPATFQACR